ncbi:MAG: STAS domain-containing protein [bacterium]
MIQFSNNTIDGKISLSVSGRIDGLTSKQLEAEFVKLIESGVRIIVANIKEVIYISSLGLRVFLKTHQKLTQAGGELIIYQPGEEILATFKMGGFDRIFKIFNLEEELKSNIIDISIPKDSVITERQLDNKRIKSIKKSDSLGSLSVIGSTDKLSHSSYSEKDVQLIPSNQIRFGLGLAAIGDEYENYKTYFGEALVINNSIIYYPAVRHSAVDIMEYSQTASVINYNFLNGFSFNGSFNYVLSINSIGEYFSLSEINDILLEETKATALGIVFIAESKGIYGLNLKKTPIIDNAVGDKTIFDSDNFTDWMNYPIEPHDAHHVVAGCGVLIKDYEDVRRKYSEILPNDSNFHIHGAVFGKGIINSDLGNIENELNKLTSNFEINKVQHLLPNSKFSNIVVGIIVLE